MSTFQVAEDTHKQGDKRSLLSYCLERSTLLFATKLALIVGTILALINHGQALFTGHLGFDQLIPMLITYFVPFTVSMYSQAQGKRARDRLYAEVIAATRQAGTDASSSE